MFSVALRAAFFVTLVAVFVLALLPPDAAETLSFGWDKANHLLAFGVLAALGIAGFPGRGRAVLLGLLAYGVLIEWAQAMTPARTAQWLDVIADAVGIAIGWGAAAALRWAGGHARGPRRGGL
jgi:VanZ family protein